MSFDSLDYYSETTLSPAHYQTLKTMLLDAYDQHRCALKQLLDIVQPITQQRFEQSCHGQSASTIFLNVVQEIVDGYNNQAFKVSANLADDIQHLVLIMSDPHNPDIISLEDHWSVRHVSDEVFEKHWPELSDNPEALVCSSKSVGRWTFDDAKGRVSLNIASDFQGDQWGLNNAMTKALDEFLAHMEQNHLWTVDSGFISRTIDHNGFQCPKHALGNPPKPEGFGFDGDDDYESFKAHAFSNSDGFRARLRGKSENRTEYL